jgi:hypothetical protein
MYAAYLFIDRAIAQASTARGPAPARNAAAPVPQRPRAAVPWWHRLLAPRKGMVRPAVRTAR